MTRQPWVTKSIQLLNLARLCARDRCHNLEGPTMLVVKRLLLILIAHGSPLSRLLFISQKGFLQNLPLFLGCSQWRFSDSIHPTPFDRGIPSQTHQVGFRQDFLLLRAAETYLDRLLAYKFPSHIISASHLSTHLYCCATLFPSFILMK